MTKVLIVGFFGEKHLLNAQNVNVNVNVNVSSGTFPFKHTAEAKQTHRASATQSQRAEEDQQQSAGQEGQLQLKRALCLLGKLQDVIHSGHTIQFSVLFTHCLLLLPNN